LDYARPLPADRITTQYYGSAAISCLTPTTEEAARQVATGFHRPAHRYEAISADVEEEDLADEDIGTMTYDDAGQESYDDCEGRPEDFA
jgi:hypothetical protein